VAARAEVIEEEEEVDDAEVVRANEILMKTI